MIDLPGAEIVAFDRATARAVVTGHRGVCIVNWNSGGAPRIDREVDAAGAAALPFLMEGEVSHAAIDPRGRGVAAASVIPRDRAGLPGRVVFIDLSSGEPLASIVVGYAPDSLCFTPDGAFVIVANEGEPAALPGGGLNDPPGSVTVIRVEKFDRASGFRRLNQRDALTLSLSGPAFEAALSASEPERQVRVHPLCRAGAALDLEPESVAADAERAFVTLQENNAVAVLRLRPLEWELVAPLGTVEQRVMVSASGSETMSVHAMPMPDQLSLARIGDRALLVTADEGEDRGELGEPDAPLFADAARLKHLNKSGRMSPASWRAIADAGDAGTRLKVCAFSGDTDADGLIDRPTLHGTRSISVWDPATLQRVGFAGDQIEQAIAREYPRLLNADSSSPPFVAGARSDDRGPEPEGIALARVGSATIAFVTLERPGGIAAFDLSQPERPILVGLRMTAAEGGRGPEGITFIPAADSPTGRDALLIAFESSGQLGVFHITLKSEPGATAP